MKAPLFYINLLFEQSSVHTVRQGLTNQRFVPHVYIPCVMLQGLVSLSAPCLQNLRSHTNPGGFHVGYVRGYTEGFERMGLMALCLYRDILPLHTLLHVLTLC
jgi:hypothetical protein